MTEDPTRIPRIIGKHVHDVRNSINCLNLIAELLNDLSTDPQLASPLAMMRSDLTQLEATVNSLQFKFAEPRSSSITADDLMQLWKKQITPLENATHHIVWSPPPAPGILTVDVDAILSVLREWVIGGWYRTAGGTLKLAVNTASGSVLVEVREAQPKPPPNAHDLEEARRLVTMNGGALDVSEDTVTGERVVMLKFAAGD